MATVLDVSRYIIDRLGPMTAMKLQKLVYYSKAWHLVWEEEELFQERIEAWANGPVSPVLYARHRGRFRVDSSLFDSSATPLAPHEAESVDAVLNFYGSRTAADLSELSHLEYPWRGARGGLQPGERCTTEITSASMAEYYSSLV